VVRRTFRMKERMQKMALRYRSTTPTRSTSAKRTKLNGLTAGTCTFSDQVDSSMTHWLAILNSLTISGVLGVTVLVIWGRTVQGDIKGRGDGVLEEGKLKLGSKNTRSRSRSEKSSREGLLGQSPGRGSDADVSDEEVEISRAGNCSMLMCFAFLLTAAFLRLWWGPACSYSSWQLGSSSSAVWVS